MSGYVFLRSAAPSPEPGLHFQNIILRELQDEFEELDLDTSPSPSPEPLGSDLFYRPIPRSRSDGPLDSTLLDRPGGLSSTTTDYRVQDSSTPRVIPTVYSSTTQSGYSSSFASDQEAIMSMDQDTSIASDQDLHDNALDEQDQGGLFGSGSEDEGSGAENISNKRRKLGDEELDSGDDEGRRDRERDGVDGYDQEAELQESNASILSADIGRQSDPKPSDGELYLLAFPNFIGVAPQNFTLKHFQPNTTDHHSSGPPSSTFSAYQTSNNTVRWRHSPSDPEIIQSNSRILRWSDGSLTLQLASNPREQFELAAKPLAQPQVNPRKPTPTSLNRSRTLGPLPYNPRQDSHTYLGAPHEHAQLVRFTNHITAALAVQSSSDQNDEALIRLKEQMAEAQKGSKKTADGGLAVISINEDPELAKRRAEMAEKEKSKMQRRLQVQQDRETTRSNNVLKRSGLRTGGMGAGLTIGGLEDDDGMATTKGRVSKPKSHKPRRRNSEYSDDEEDFRGRGRTREDEYDEDDGFLVGSDEEPEVGEESEEEEEMGDEGDENIEKEKLKKRESEEAAGGRTKRRRVIEDEDED